MDSWVSCLFAAPALLVVVVVVSHGAVLLLAPLPVPDNLFALSDFAVLS
jgi:hypothetical protein